MQSIKQRGLIKCHYFELREESLFCRYAKYGNVNEIEIDYIRFKNSESLEAKSGNSNLLLTSIILLLLTMFGSISSFFDEAVNIVTIISFGGSCNCFICWVLVYKGKFLEDWIEKW